MTEFVPESIPERPSRPAPEGFERSRMIRRGNLVLCQVCAASVPEDLTEIHRMWHDQMAPGS